MGEKEFSQNEIEAIAKAFGHSSEGLTGTEIGQLLKSLQFSDRDEGSTKWLRLHNAFVRRQNKDESRRAILAFIRRSMNPQRHISKPDRYEALRSHLNRALSFSGLAVNAAGELLPVEKARTLADANKRAADLKADLVKRGVHADVLKFCRAELVEDNYFHAVLEATKSIGQKIRDKSGLTEDGAPLVDKAFSGIAPTLKINSFRTESQQGEQRGFVNLLKGVFGMFRNPTAHEARLLWAMTKEDAEDLLSIASLIHRRLDSAQ